jgi:DNA-binding NarL/FixJ family response regulator
MQEAVDELTTKKIFIVGGNKLQNELITSALEEETGFSCMVVEDLAEIRRILQAEENCECLALYDCLGKEAGACIADLEQNRNDEDLMLGLFNLGKGQGLEKDAFACGVRAFFYRGEPFNTFLKGVLGIFKGEYWISRQLLTEWVSEQTPALQPAQRLLSDAEKKMLTLLANGASNKEIADALCMSPHTVKKHFQKLFRKIQVHSKTEAVLWASRHL